MILVFGGTTEGRKAAEVLEEAGASYFYSTKTGEQDLVLHHGSRIDGALDADAMQDFCVHHGVRLIVDATHPFAQRLHETIAAVTVRLQIPVIRYERIYPERASELTWIDDYSELPALLTPSSTLLATTGVQSISKLKPLEDLGIKVYYRILPRESSVALAKAQGATTDQLRYYESSSQIDTNADAILLKESGLSGGFIEKVNVAKEHGMRIVVLKRPAYPHAEAYSVNGPYGLRRAVEKLLPEFFPLHSGLTTGTCATAAAMAATMQWLRQQGESQSVLPSEVPVRLPNGETISVAVGYGDNYAYCIKEAGDDPDVTNGIEVRATVTQEHGKNADDITIKGGEGVGTFTLPGFDYPPGSPAINKAPRAMIRQNLRLLRQAPSAVPDELTITISVPHGAEIAQRTFNPRLGIEGGISIIGVSGIVKPFSEEAFIESIRKCMTVAKASGSERVVINSGGKSERFVKERYPDFDARPFVDTAPISDRHWAVRAGLGWIGRNTLFIHPHFGSYCFLGEIVTTAQVDRYDEPFRNDPCGDCRLCVDACPNKAIIDRQTKDSLQNSKSKIQNFLDARRCTSYNTIENRAESLPDELDTRGYAFGCDICQSVCPYNRQAPSAYHLDDERKAQLEALPDADEAVFRRFTKHSALSRIKYPQWQRNINKSRR